MTPAACTLAEFAVGLKYADIPKGVVERSKACIIDTVATSMFGVTLPWSKIVIEYVRNNTAPGNASVMGTDVRARAALAALANGTLAHAFELDSPVHPSVGVHPGPGCVSPGLAVAQELGMSGRDLIAAFVAGFEVMHRMGSTAPQSCEALGFHAPGLFGVFGGAITAGRLMALDVERMTNALGVAGSLCSGLLEFSRGGGGPAGSLIFDTSTRPGASSATAAMRTCRRRPVLVPRRPA